MRNLYKLSILLLLVALIGASGCRSRSKMGLPPGIHGLEVSQPLQPIISQMDRDGERNWVLHLNELAVAAMRAGDRETAKRALDESILQINAVFGTTPESRRARQLFFSEDVKLFKGEPYERAMAYFYRGVLYMQEGDYNNARACFRGAAFQDSFAEEEQNRNDWVIFDYLIAVCEMQLGRRLAAENSFRFASRNFAEFPQKYRGVFNEQLPIVGKELQFPSPESNLLIIVQDGIGPQKIRVGDYGQFLGIRRIDRRFIPSMVSIGEEKPKPAMILDSVSFQALTRGGRPVDRWQKRKAFFRGTSELAGDISLTAGTLIFATADSEQQAIVGLALVGTGVAMTALASLARPGADIRQWGSLPDALSIYTRSLPAGPTTVRINARNNTALETEVNLPEPGRGMKVLLTFDSGSPALLLPP